MNTRDRLEHLRTMLDRLERMPASADRDWMLSELRARAVDVETGVKPAKMRALPRDDANAEVAVAESERVRPAATPARREPMRVARSRPATARAVSISPSPPAHENADDPLQPGVLLSLDEPPDDAAATARPWASGLRG
jgi:hypothetical protein